MLRHDVAVFWSKVSPDGRFLVQAPSVGMELQERGAIVDLQNGQARELQLADGDQPIAWDQDGRNVFAAQERSGLQPEHRLRGRPGHFA